MFEIPKEIAEANERLNELVSKYPLEIPAYKCAKFLGMTEEGLRSALYDCRCPFGFGWKNAGKQNRGFTIPTFTFYMWYTASRFRGGADGQA